MGPRASVRCRSSRGPPSPTRCSPAGMTWSASCSAEGGDPGLAIRRSGLDVAFLALHGRCGEDGCVQGFCELYGIPYTGSSVLASALAMDKLKSKELFRLHNLPTPPYYTVSGPTTLADPRRDPRVVRLSGDREAARRGVVARGDQGELGRSSSSVASTEALALDDVALVERFVVGKEVQVGILDGRVLGAIEIAPKKGIYDYESEVHARDDRVLHARAPPHGAVQGRPQSGRARGQGARVHRAACASICS